MDLKSRRKELGLTLQEVADKVGVGASTVRKWENGLIGNIKQDKIPKLADALKVSVFDILGMPNTNFLPDNIETEVVKIPIIGRIACGTPIMSEENIIGYEEEPASSADSGECFYMQTEGDSMIPTVPIGARVKIRIQPEVESGEIAAVDINGELTLKRVKKQGDTVMLIPDNRKYDPIILHKDDYNRIIGKAIKVSYDL